LDLQADGAIRLHWASELVFEPSDPGQDMRYMGTVEPLWTLFDLTPEVSLRAEAKWQIHPDFEYA
jgi:predicted dithiol-disulfide oxidoreductase (DUF899 family)